MARCGTAERDLILMATADEGLVASMVRGGSKTTGQNFRGSRLFAEWGFCTTFGSEVAVEVTQKVPMWLRLTSTGRLDMDLRRKQKPQ